MLTQPQAQLLTDGARQLGVPLSDEGIAQFSLYLEEIERWAKVTNLVAQTDPEIFIRKHFLDSLAIVPLVPSDGRLLDLGSGAGFPGLVLAIVSPSLEVSLVEPRRKRANFLREVMRKTQLSNARVYEERAEVLVESVSFRNVFCVVVTRATWNLQEFLRLASPFMTEDGMALAMKGTKGEKELIGLEASFLQARNFYLKKRHKYMLPFGGEERLAIIFAKECFT
jgi:16S rRNA (guanine527-N7)-methyltransferase